MASFPTITFTNIKHKVIAGLSEGVITYQDETITPVFNNGVGSTVYKASYNFPFNSVSGNFTPNRELSRFEIRVNPIEEDDFGPGIGNLAFSKINDMPANASRSFLISITTNTFTGSNSGTYRICLMGQSSVDYSWDCTQLFMTINISKAAHGRVPNEYQKVEYIQSSGAQYINTNYIPTTNNIILDIDATWMGSSLGAFETFIGFMYSTSQATPRIGLHKYNSKFMFGANNTINSTVAPTSGTRFNLRGNFISGAQKLFLDGTQIASSTGSFAFNANTCPVYIFARYCPNSMNYATMRLYRAKIYEGDTLVRDFVPCYRKSDSAIGLYDLVNDNFYVNNGSGAFTKGDNVTYDKFVPKNSDGYDVHFDTIV